MRKAITFLMFIILMWSCFACTPVVINGVKVKDRTSHKVDPHLKFYGTASFLIGAGLSAHFFHKDR